MLRHPDSINENLLYTPAEQRWNFYGPLGQDNPLELTSFQTDNETGRSRWEPALPFRFPNEEESYVAQGILPSASYKMSLEPLTSDSNFSFNFIPKSSRPIWSSEGLEPPETTNTQSMSMLSYSKFVERYGEISELSNADIDYGRKPYNEDQLKDSNFTVQGRPGDSVFKLEILPVGRYSQYNAIRFWNGICPIRVKFKELSWITETENSDFVSFFAADRTERRPSERRGESDYRATNGFPEIRYNFGIDKIIMKFDNINGGGSPSITYTNPNSLSRQFTPATDSDKYHMFNWWFSKENWWDLIVRFIYSDTVGQKNNQAEENIVLDRYSTAVGNIIAEQFRVFNISVNNFSTFAPYDGSPHNWANQSDYEVSQYRDRLRYRARMLSNNPVYSTNNPDYLLTRFNQEVVYNSDTERFYPIMKRFRQIRVYGGIYEQYTTPRIERWSYLNMKGKFTPPLYYYGILDRYSSATHLLWDSVRFLPTHDTIANRLTYKDTRPGHSVSPDFGEVPSINVALPTKLTFIEKSTVEPHASCIISTISQDIIDYNIVNKIISFEDSQNCFALCSKLNNLQNSKNILHKIRD